MNIKKEKIDVGIVIGRFQLHVLHDAHKEMIDTVCKNHDRVLIFLGLSPLRNTTRNPLDFHSRREMIRELYSKVEIYYIEDRRTDEEWSKHLDLQIAKWLKPHQTCILYGSRDSFIPHYTGKYKTTELEPSKYISGTDVRRQIANSYIPDTSFRAGVISASMNRYPTCYPTVDVAIIDETKCNVLLGKKDGEEFLRFIGGFADPKSHSYEIDAKREVTEETGVEIDNIRYIGSTLIDDFRYRGEQDKIKTLFFVASYIFGRPEGADDIAEVQWVSLGDLVEGKIKVMPEHQVLVDMLKTYMNKQKVTS